MKRIASKFRSEELDYNIATDMSNEAKDKDKDLMHIEDKAITEIEDIVYFQIMPIQERIEDAISKG